MLVPQPTKWDVPGVGGDEKSDEEVLDRPTSE